MSTTVTITRLVYATATSKEDFDALARHAKAVGWLSMKAEAPETKKKKHPR